MDNHAIVIGAGPAGASCASWLAQQGIAATVLEAAAEPMPLLARLDLRQDWVLGAPATSTAALGRQYAAHVRSMPRITLRCGVRIAGIEALARGRMALRLDDGQVLVAQALVIATGLRPRRTPWPATGDAALLDAIALTVGREQFPAGQRILLMGGGDNAAENAHFLASRGHRVVLWARGDWRAQATLREAALQTPGVEVRLRTPLPDTVVHERGSWHVSSAAHGSETFDQAAALFGYEPDDGAWAQLRASPAWQAAGWPDLPIVDAHQLAAEGLFLAGDVSQRLHPSIQTALADGVTAAKHVAHWLSLQRTPA
jgi:thioredoxin reductase